MSAVLVRLPPLQRKGSSDDLFPRSLSQQALPIGRRLCSVVTPRANTLPTPLCPSRGLLIRVQDASRRGVPLDQRDLELITKILSQTTPRTVAAVAARVLPPIALPAAPASPLDSSFRAEATPSQSEARVVPGDMESFPMNERERIRELERQLAEAEQKLLEREAQAAQAKEKTQPAGFEAREQAEALYCFGKRASEFYEYPR